MTCPSLSSSTILQVLHTALLTQIISTRYYLTGAQDGGWPPDGHPFLLITPDPFSVLAFEAFR